MLVSVEATETGLLYLPSGQNSNAGHVRNAPAPSLAFDYLPESSLIAARPQSLEQRSL